MTALRDFEPDYDALSVQAPTGTAPGWWLRDNREHREEWESETREVEAEYVALQDAEGTVLPDLHVECSLCGQPCWSGLCGGCQRGWDKQGKT